MLTFDGNYISDTIHDGDYTAGNIFDGDYGTFKSVSNAEVYEGDYEITPTGEEQIIPIMGKIAADNFTIKPIPQNYGLITWNGSILTVS